jgi:hypothetical protein
MNHFMKAQITSSYTRSNIGWFTSHVPRAGKITHVLTDNLDQLLKRFVRNGH